MEQQGLILIVSALYSNNKLMKWNRENFSNYYEIFRCQFIFSKKKEILRIYIGSIKEKEKNIVGIDIPWNPPQNYDLKIIMDEKTKVKDVIKLIASKLKIFQNLGL